MKFTSGLQSWPKILDVGVFQKRLVNVCRIENMYLDGSHFGIRYGEE